MKNQFEPGLNSLAPGNANEWKNTLYSEALIFILELLSQVKSDGHENLRGASVYRDKSKKASFST